MTTSMITHTTTRHMRHIVATMTTTMTIATMPMLILTMGMTTHRIVMNHMSNTATTLTLILTKAMTTRHTSTIPILTTLILTRLTLIIMARVSPSRRSRPRRLGSWWRR